MDKAGISRRQFIKQASLLASLLPLNACRVSLRDGMRNPCLHESLAQIRQTSQWAAAWQDIDASQVWDCHCHLVGVGDSDSGIEVNSAMRSWWHPIQHSQFSFYLNASCAATVNENDAVASVGSIDSGVVNRLIQLGDDFDPGYKMMLLAFDHYYDENGQRQDQYSAFHVPNHYAAKMAASYRQRFEWTASIHPYRKDALQQLQWCVEHGAKAIKWLPGAMGINPASPLCDDFYHALVAHKLPLLSHSGTEHAVETPSGQSFNNPLLLRRAIDIGVRVIVAHCASLGEFVDLDAGVEAQTVSGYELFKRLIKEQGERNNLYGDISAIVLVNREPEIIADIVSNKALHQRLVYGSDYPLPGIMPLINTGYFVDKAWLNEEQQQILDQVRQSNSLLFDFLLKRFLQVEGTRLSPLVFHSRRVFEA